MEDHLARLKKVCTRLAMTEGAHRSRHSTSSLRNMSTGPQRSILRSRP